MKVESLLGGLGLLWAFWGSIGLLFGGSFKLATRAIWSCKPLIFIQLLKLQRINPFPQELILPQNFFPIPSQFSIFSCPCFYHVHVHESRWTQPGPPHAFFLHLVQGKEVVGPEARTAQVASETRGLEGHVVDIAMVLVHTALETF